MSAGWRTSICLSKRRKEVCSPDVLFHEHSSVDRTLMTVWNRTGLIGFWVDDTATGVKPSIRVSTHILIAGRKELCPLGRESSCPAHRPGWFDYAHHKFRRGGFLFDKNNESCIISVGSADDKYFVRKDDLFCVRHGSLKGSRKRLTLCLSRRREGCCFFAPNIPLAVRPRKVRCPNGTNHRNSPPPEEDGPR